MAIRRISDARLSILLEHSRMNREKSLMLLDKAILMYFSFIFVAVVGFVGGYIDAKFLNVMIVLSFGVLAIGIFPYILTMTKEEKKLKELMEPTKRGKK